MAKKPADKNMMVQADGSVQGSISFQLKIDETLVGIAKQEMVSLAWVVREAAEQYIATKSPLFSQKVYVSK